MIGKARLGEEYGSVQFRQEVKKGAKELEKEKAVKRELEMRRRNEELTPEMLEEKKRAL